MTPARDIVGDDKAEAAADRLATAFDAAQVADAIVRESRQGKRVVRLLTEAGR